MQYGVFPGAREPVPGPSYTSDQGPSSAPPTSRPYTSDHGSFYPPSYTGYPPVGSPEAYRASSDSSSRLLGPGMPGPDLIVGIPQRGRGMRHVSSVPSGSSAGYTSYPRVSQSPTQPAPAPMPSPLSPHPGVRPARAFSRTLPPLSVPTQGSSSAPVPHVHPTSPFTLSTPVTPSTFRFRLTPSPPLQYTSEQSTSSSSSSLYIPPPFALQPQPQWDNSTFSSRQSSWSHSESRQQSSQSPPHTREAADADSSTYEDITPRLEHPPLRQSGRYDPVRAIFVPYTPFGDVQSPSSPKDDKP